MAFINTYEHSIDSKSRLAVPSEVRRELEWNTATPNTPVTLYVTMGDDQSLCVYEKEVFEDRAKQLQNSDMDPDELVRCERLLFSLTTRVELDPQGRIRIPDHLLRLAKLGNDVVIIGCNDHMEVRDRKTWLSYVEQSVADDPKLWSKLRRAMRQGTSRGGTEA
ncbi:MAG: hypothetical protein WD768_02500 [Phycisphaeraceae bacterium]